MKLVGLSLSMCVSDLVNGIVKIEDVDYIIAATRVEDEAEFSLLINHYAKTYWGKWPYKAAMFAWELWNSERIDQPRTYGGEHLGTPGCCHWLVRF